MYTQCPQCQTVFRVTATMLKAARGKVRCGRCAHVFNALTFLIDSDEQPGEGAPVESRVEPITPPPEAPASSHLKTQRTAATEKRYDDNTPFEEDEEQELAAGEEIVLDSETAQATESVGDASDEKPGDRIDEDAGESPIDEELTLEGSADEPGEAPVEEPPLDAPGGEDPQAEPNAEELQPGADDEALLLESFDEELQLESADEDLQPGFADGASEIPEAALEFDANDLSKVFVEAPRASIPHAAGDAAGDETAEHEILDVEMETPTAPEVITLEGDTVVLADGEPMQESPPPALAPATDAASPRKPKTQEAIDLEVRREIEKAFADDPTTRAEFILPSGKKVSLHRNQDEVEVEEIDEAAEALERHTSLQRRKRIAWGASGVTLLILLGLQVIHYNRQALVQSAQVGPLLTSIYGAFGTELTPAWKVDAYDVRQWGAAADPRSGTVQVRASVTNGADHAQPYPLLRLTLLNRFGERLRQSDIEPEDYLTRAPGAGQLLGAGQRVDASIAIVDPGDEAVNFEIDVCLRRNAAVTCANDALRQRS